MHIKFFLILIYGLAGLIIASITAFMTFLIIEEPIGYTMGSKIVLTVFMTTPIIILISALIGGIFAKHINTMVHRLEKIAKGIYDTEQSHTNIKEFISIYSVGNSLSVEISTLLESLNAKNEELTMLLLTFSHDVKTPLMIANGYLEELEDHLICEASLPIIYQKLKKENNYINELCNDILTYQYSRGKSNQLKEIIIVKELADEVISLLDAPIINALDVTFDIRFNRIDLKKVLVNLLHNALKYAHLTEIRIYNINRTIVVEDSGVGIEKKYHNKIFEPFYTIDSSKNREDNGFGLGLAITKNLCQRNQFDIMYDINYQAGSRFILSRNE